MASNELASILARRRAKDGSADAPPTPSLNPSSSSTVSAEVAPITKSTGSVSNAKSLFESKNHTNLEKVPAKSPEKSSTIAERIARLKQQGEQAQKAASQPSPSPEKGSIGNEVVQSTRRTSSKIQQLQGSLGSLNMNALRPGEGGMSKKLYSSGSRSPVESNESVYKPGVPMPGLAGVPMPGMANKDMSIPGINSEIPSSEPQAEVSHNTMTRATGPRRRPPSRSKVGSGKIQGKTSEQIPSVSEEQDSVNSTIADPNPTPTFSSANISFSEYPNSSVHGNISNLDKDSLSGQAPSLYSPKNLFGADVASNDAREGHSSELNAAQSSLFSTSRPSSSNSIDNSTKVTQSIPSATLFGANTKKGSSTSLFSDDGDNEPKEQASNSLFGGSKLKGSSKSLFSDDSSDSSSPIGHGSTSIFGFSSADDRNIMNSTAASGNKEPSSSSLFGDDTMTKTQDLFGSSPTNSKNDSDSTIYGTSSTTMEETSLFHTSNNDKKSAINNPITSTPALSLVQRDEEEESSDDGEWGDSLPSIASGNGDSSYTSSFPQSNKKDTLHSFTSEALFGSATNMNSPTTTVETPAKASDSYQKDMSSSKQPVSIPIHKVPPHSSLFGGDDSDESDFSDDEGGLFGTGLPS